MGASQSAGGGASYGEEFGCGCDHKDTKFPRKLIASQKKIYDDILELQRYEAILLDSWSGKMNKVAVVRAE